MSSDAFDRDHPAAVRQPAEAPAAGTLGRGLAFKVAASVVFAVLLALSAIYVNKTALDRFFENETARYRQAQRSNAESIAGRVESEVSKLQERLFNLSRIAAIRHNDSAAMLEAMERAYLIIDEQVDGIYRVDRNGAIVQAVPGPDDAPTTRELRPFMDRANRAGQPVIATIRRHRDARDILVLARPVYAAADAAEEVQRDSFSGLILFTVSLARLNSQVFDFGSPRDRAARFAIDGNGLLLGAPFDAMIGWTVDELPAQPGLSEIERRGLLGIAAEIRGDRAGNEAESEEPGGGPIAYAPIRLDGARWSVALIIPSADVGRASAGALRTFWLSAGAFFAVVVAMAAVVVTMLHGAYRERTRKAALSERMAREDEEKYRTLVENASDASIVLTPAGKIVYCNPAYAALLGIDGDTDTRVRFFDTVTPRFRDLVVDRFNTQWWSTGTPGNLDIAIATRNGQERAFELVMRPIRYRGAQASMLVLHDATQRTRIEDALRKAKDEADAANAAKSEFLARMSHEIRTPMNGVIGVADILMKTDLSEKQRMFVDTIRRSGHALLMVINDILDFSKIEAGRLELETIDFDLRTTVEDIADLLAPRATAKGLVLACRIPADMPTALRGDPYRLRQALTNLLGNAVKFTVNGEVALSVSMASESDDTILLRFDVRDTGIGIEARTVGRIFEPFSQADGAIAREFGGTGLGLAITKRLVEVMGGEVGVESKLGEGSLFWFTAEFEKRAAGRGNPVASHPLRGLKILIVEANRTNQDILRELIETWGMTADIASTGAQALKSIRDGVARGRPYALVLMERELPDMDGLNLARAMRMAPDLENIRIMIMSATGDDNPRVALNAGVDGWINKPVRHSALFDNLAEIILKADADDPACSADAPVAAQADRAIGTHVLVAEDNPVNQIVAKESLVLLGCQVDLVGDGKQAVDAWSAGSHDIVLMDMQMPVMDGRSATAAIRERETLEPGKPRTPIVALTANAMKGERERCIAAGMDDFIAKPFTIDDLRAILRKWGRHRRAPGTDADAIPTAKEETMVPADRTAPQASEQPILDEAALGMISDMGQTGAPNPLTKVIDIYLDYSPKLIGEIESAIADRDAEGLCRAAHSLKSSSASLGAHALAEQCKELETMGRDGTVAGAGRILEAIHAQFDLVCVALKGVRDKLVAQEMA